MRAKLINLSSVNKSGHAFSNDFNGDKGSWLPLQPIFMGSCSASNAGVLVEGPYSDAPLCSSFIATDKSIAMSTMLYRHQHMQSYPNAFHATIAPPQAVSTNEIYEEDVSQSIIISNRKGIYVLESESEIPCTNLQNHTHVSVVPSLVTNAEMVEAPMNPLQGQNFVPSKVTVAVPGSISQSYMPQTRTQASINSRRCRARITEGIKSLQEVLPPAKKVCRESVLDAAIDYVKKLKIQIKVLSQSRCTGKDKSDLFTHIEGCGFYLVDEDMSKEPLEETLERLMKSDMEAAIHYLKRRGLALLPLALVN